MKVVIKTEEEIRATKNVTESSIIGIPSLHMPLKKGTVFEGLPMITIPFVAGKTLKVCREDKLRFCKSLPKEYPYFLESTDDNPGLYIPAFIIKEELYSENID